MAVKFNSSGEADYDTVNGTNQDEKFIFKHAGFRKLQRSRGD